MGVNLYVMTRRTEPMVIGDVLVPLHILHKTMKLTEMTKADAGDLAALRAKARTGIGGGRLAVRPSRDTEEVLIERDEHPVVRLKAQGRPVYGWDNDLTDVPDTDFGHLNIVGYALPDLTGPGGSMLFELVDRSGPTAVVRLMSEARAVELNILTAQRRLASFEQPSIQSVLSTQDLPEVGLWLAEVMLSNGRAATLSGALNEDWIAMTDKTRLVGWRPLFVPSAIELYRRESIEMEPRTDPPGQIIVARRRPG